jgi:MT-A70
MSSNDPRRQRPIRVRFISGLVYGVRKHPPTYRLKIDENEGKAGRTKWQQRRDHKVWAAIEWSPTRERWCIEDAAGRQGYWTRSNTEACLFATKGAPMRLATDVHQVVLAPVGEHSAKPEEVRRRIERLFGGPFLELYGRRPVAGWTVWGNEIPREQFREATVSYFPDGRIGEVDGWRWP